MISGRIAAGVDGNISFRKFAEEIDQEASQEQKSTYPDFCEIIRKVILIDHNRLGFVHDATFSAENDAWNMCWRGGTGIPLAQLKERFDVGYSLSALAQALGRILRVDNILYELYRDILDRIDRTAPHG